MKYYLAKREIELGQQEVREAYSGWEKYGVPKGLWSNVVHSKPSDYFSRDEYILNPHTVGPKILGGKLIVKNPSALQYIRDNEQDGAFYYGSDSLNFALLPRDFIEIDFQELLRYANTELTQFFDECLDVVWWPNNLITRRIGLSAKIKDTRKLAHDVLGSENISRTHKVELLQQTV